MELIPLITGLWKHIQVRFFSWVQMADSFVSFLVSLDHSCFNILSSNLLFHNENKYTSPFHFSNGTLKFSGSLSLCGTPVLNMCPTQWLQTSCLSGFSLQEIFHLPPCACKFLASLGWWIAFPTQLSCSILWS